MFLEPRSKPIHALARSAAAGLIAFAIGCGGSDSSSSDADAPSPSDVAGTWHEDAGTLSCTFEQAGGAPITATFGNYDFDVVVVGSQSLLIDGLTAAAHGVGPNLEATTTTQSSTGFACGDGSELISRFTNRYVFFSGASTGLVDRQWIVGCASGSGACGQEINDPMRKIAGS